MKKISIIALSIIVLGSGGYFLYENTHKITPNTNEEKPTAVGVRRAMSTQGKIREAKKLIDDAQFPKASLLLASVIQEDQTIIDPYEFLGEIYVQTQDFEKLASLINAIDEKFPNDPLGSILEIKKLIAEERFQEVLTIIESIEVVPNDLVFYQAVLLSLQNNHNKSREILAKLADMPVGEEPENISEKLSEKTKGLLAVYDNFDTFADGKSPHLFVLISKELAENNEAILAKEFASIAIKEDPEYVDGWILRGYSAYLMQDYNNALEDLYQGYELDPSRPEVYYFLALALEKSGNLPEAAVFFEKSLEFDFEFSTEIRWKLIEILIDQKKYERVIDLYRELVAENPEPEQFVSATNTLLNIFKNPQAAIEITKELSEQDSENVLSLNLYAWSLIENSDLDEAEIVLKKTLNLNEENPRTALNLGLLYEAYGDYTLAREWFKKSYEYGEGRGFDDIVNLAADNFNNLIDQENPATLSPNDKRDASSP